MSDDFQKTTPRFCGNCGQKLLEGATFCAYCGSQVPPVDSTGIVSSKPSSGYTPIPPSVSDRVSPAYPTPYGPPKIKTEPPLPFTQHFQGVLLSPQLEMPRILKRPNLKHPFFIVLIAGEKFRESGYILQILIVATGAIFMGSIFSHAIVALNKQKTVIPAYAFTALIALIGYFIFIPLYSYYGAAWMTVCSEIVISLIVFFVFSSWLVLP